MGSEMKKWSGPCLFADLDYCQGDIVGRGSTIREGVDIGNDSVYNLFGVQMAIPGETLGNPLLPVLLTLPVHHFPDPVAAEQDQL
jgi:hypothetical protein